MIVRLLTKDLPFDVFDDGIKDIKVNLGELEHGILDVLDVLGWCDFQLDAN
jgi:hypothetical protein